jgi:hypothetical protein
MTDSETISTAATAAWAQLVANVPDLTFTPEARAWFELGFGACLVAVTAGGMRNELPNLRAS